MLLLYPHKCVIYLAAMFMFFGFDHHLFSACWLHWLSDTCFLDFIVHIFVKKHLSLERIFLLLVLCEEPQNVKGWQHNPRLLAMKLLLSHFVLKLFVLSRIKKMILIKKFPYC